MGRHAAAPGTFDAIVSDYVTQRARELVRQADELLNEFPVADVPRSLADPLSAAEWIGAATEILRELIRDA